MKKILFMLITALPMFAVAQTTTVAGDYKSIFIGDNGVGDYTRNLILLHEIYGGGAPVDMNYAVGTITAFRGGTGAGNRINVAQITSSSAYVGVSAMIQSLDGFTAYKLKTCIYNGKKYLAVDVPYAPAYHNIGYRFNGQTLSTGENMKTVAYEVQGQPVNQNLISAIQDYQPNMDESHFVNNFSVMGNVGIGTLTPSDKLSVNGNIRAREVKVETTNWPDYVFAPAYKKMSLNDLEQYIFTNNHLPNMPSAAEAEKNGVELGEMNRRLLEKVEELTLYIIHQSKFIAALESKVKTLQKHNKIKTK